MSVARGTVHSIQFLRFLAATLVVVFHAHLGLTTRLPGGGMSAQEGYWLGFGSVGVHIFFVISGYIMYLTNVARPQPFAPARFFSRRLIRIFPTYWMFVALYLAVGAVLTALPALTPGQFAGAILLLPGEASGVIGPAWTLSFELYFYFAFGLAMVLGARRGVWLLTAAFTVSVVLGLALRPTSAATALITSSLLLEFVAGVWIARVTNERSLPRLIGWLALLGAAAGYAAGLAYGYDRLPSALIWGVPSALLVAGAVVLDQTARPDRRPGPIRRLSVLGDSSYSLYLCHILLVTIATTALARWGVTPPRALAVAAVTLACIGFAHAFYLAVERRVVGLLHRLTERRVTPSPPAGAGAAAS